MISTIGIVSLSSGIIGEDFVKHEVDLGVRRLKDLGLNPIFLPHSLKGLDFIKDHPEARAEDLIHAFSDDNIDNNPMCHRWRRYLSLTTLSF